MADKTHIVIAEDNPRDREYLLKTLTDYELELSDTANKALEICSEYAEPFLISDLQMPDMNGIELAKRLWQLRPNARILFWSHYGDETYIRSLSQIIPEETVYGYILKDNPSHVLKKATSAVFDDCQCWLDPKLKTIQARSVSPHSAVSDVEYEVLIDIALGLTDNMIAQRRYLSRRGAQNRLKSLYNKLNVGHESATDNREAMNLRTRAVSIAMRRGLINSYELENEERLFQEWLSKNNIGA
ncbi:MAG: response regulator transcription factor [Thioalkalispiraceae bacterium]|jgi:DNA-binding NarL/FixJ family response regulator